MESRGPKSKSGTSVESSNSEDLQVLGSRLQVMDLVGGDALPDALVHAPSHLSKVYTSKVDLSKVDTSKYDTMPKVDG